MSFSNCSAADLGSQYDTRPRRAHLIGIAGSGMRAMAEVLLGWDWKLSGSDLNIDSVRSFAAMGVQLFQGHTAENIPSDTEYVIFSDAIPTDNPELRCAKEKSLPTTSYFQTIGRLTVGRPTLAVAGTHGKSTTTAMAAHLLVEAGSDPTVFCGAALLGKTTGGRAGCQENGLIVVEACEYRSNFLHLRPQQAVILGIELDHFDCFDSLGPLEQAFAQFVASVPRDGLVLARHDCASTRRVISGLSCQMETFGFDADADWSAQNLSECNARYGFTVWHRNRRVCEVQLPMPGRHNVLNALAAIALACNNGLSASQIATDLESFPGLQRRLEQSNAGHGITLIEDYAHHPTEVTATLTTVRGMFPNRRVWCVFQPHQVSRTARLLDELAVSLQNAEKVLVAEIFRAREGTPRPGEVTAADLAARARMKGVDVLPGHSAEEIVNLLETHLVPGDVVVILGAGDTIRLRPPKLDCHG